MKGGGNNGRVSVDESPSSEEGDWLRSRVDTRSAHECLRRVARETKEFASTRPDRRAPLVVAFLDDVGANVNNIRSERSQTRARR